MYVKEIQERLKSLNLWKRLKSLMNGSSRRLETSYQKRAGKPGTKLPAGVQVGSIVAFALNPPIDPHTCATWSWEIGLLIEHNDETGMCKVLFKNRVYENDVGWIAPSTWVDCISSRK